VGGEPAIGVTFTFSSKSVFTFSMKLGVWLGFSTSFMVCILFLLSLSGFIMINGVEKRAQCYGSNLKC
jgi:hypothetical protein